MEDYVPFLQGHFDMQVLCVFVEVVHGIHIIHIYTSYICVFIYSVQCLVYIYISRQ